MPFPAATPEPRRTSPYLLSALTREERRLRVIVEALHGYEIPGAVAAQIRASLEDLQDAIRALQHAPTTQAHGTTSTPESETR